MTILSTTLRCVLIGVFMTLICLLLLQVIARYGFGYASVYLIETSQILFVWLCFLGIVEGYRRGSHVYIELIIERIPPKLASVFVWSTHALNAIAFTMIMWGGTRLSYELYGSVTSGMEVSVLWLYTAPIVAGALLVLFWIEKVWMAATSWSERSKGVLSI